MDKAFRRIASGIPNTRAQPAMALGLAILAAIVAIHLSIVVLS